MGFERCGKCFEICRYQNVPKDGQFIDMAKAHRLLDWVVEAHGEEYLLEAGLSLPKQMGGDLKFMLASALGFDRILKRVPREISKLTFGEDSVDVSVDENSASIRLKGFRMDDNSCVFWRGVLIGVMKVTRTSGEIEIAESGNEQDCLLNARWQ